jgi:transcriptional regulator with GAF, ATPase, and Fis domain
LTARARAKYVAGVSGDSTASLQRPRRARADAALRLTVVHPPLSGGRRAVIVARARVELGRAASGDAPAIAHPTLSRRHFAVEPAGARFVLRDLGSRNGTWVDGARVEGERSAPLDDNAVVRAGDVLLVVETTPPPDEDRARAVSRDAAPGDSTAMARLRAELSRAAADPAPLLIVGETGAGKERLAREAHRLSARRGPLLTLNCAALSPQLVESQLFGHVKGAFTGAADAQPGLFRGAHEGTLFLDEVGELPADAQAKLLRAIQEREVLAVGATRPVRVDVRVIAATNRDLAQAAEAGGFRRDLYARLSLWELHVPPLRRRRVDLIEWIERLDARFRRERGLDGKLELTADAAEALLLAAWPLNLRGVDRLVHHFAEARAAIGKDELPTWATAADGATSTTGASTVSEKPGVPTRDEFVREFERLGGSVNALAKHFRRDRRQIYRWLEQHGLRTK